MASILLVSVSSAADEPAADAGGRVPYLSDVYVVRDGTVVMNEELYARYYEADDRWHTTLEDSMYLEQLFLQMEQDYEANQRASDSRIRAIAGTRRMPRMVMEEAYQQQLTAQPVPVPEACSAHADAFRSGTRDGVDPGKYMVTHRVVEHFMDGLDRMGASQARGCSAYALGDNPTPEAEQARDCCVQGFYAGNRLVYHAMRSGAPETAYCQDDYNRGLIAGANACKTSPDDACRSIDGLFDYTDSVGCFSMGFQFRYQDCEPRIATYLSQYASTVSDQYVVDFTSSAAAWATDAPCEADYSCPGVPIERYERWRDEFNAENGL